MNIAKQLMAEMSRRNIDFIVQHIGNDPGYFLEVFDMVMRNDKVLAMRASWLLSAISDKYPELLMPYLTQIISNLEKFNHPGIRRNLLRYLSTIDLPEEYIGEMYDLCLRYTISSLEPVANRANAMQILFNISCKEPELKRELKLILNELVDNESAGIRSRSRNLIAKL